MVSQNCLSLLRLRSTPQWLSVDSCAPLLLRPFGHSCGFVWFAQVVCRFSFWLCYCWSAPMEPHSRVVTELWLRLLRRFAVTTRRRRYLPTPRLRFLRTRLLWLGSTTPRVLGTLRCTTPHQLNKRGEIIPVGVCIGQRGIVQLEIDVTLANVDSNWDDDLSCLEHIYMYICRVYATCLI